VKIYNEARDNQPSTEFLISLDKKEAQLLVAMTTFAASAKENRRKRTWKAMQGKFDNLLECFSW